jgi:hypothetical protein
MGIVAQAALQSTLVCGAAGRVLLGEYAAGIPDQPCFCTDP